MFLTIHTPTSLIIGSQIHQPWLAFILAFIAHLIFDIIPHDPKLAQDFDQWPKKRQIKTYFLMAIVDIIIISILLFILISSHKLSLTSSIAAAIIGGFLPDVLWGINDATRGKIKWLDKYSYFHSVVIHKIIKKDFILSLKWAMLSQMIIFILTLWVYLKIA